LFVEELRGLHKNIRTKRHTYQNTCHGSRGGFSDQMT
jgi:hypothetical protein